MPPAFLYGLVGYCVKEPDNVNTIALEDVSAAVTVRGFVAHIKSSLRYRNATAQPLQVTFKTPVDEGSALYHVEAKLEDRVIVAKCLEKNKAEKVYKDAVEAGQTAVLVREESETADIINLALGNLPAGAECEVTLSLVAELRVGSDGGVQFTLPTVLNPRYQPASSTGPDAPVVSHVTPVATASKPYSIQVAASVCGALDIARIISHSDPINVVMEDDNKSAKIRQDGGYRSDHEWSFVVHYNNPYSPQVLIETGDPTATGLMKDQVLMLNLFPELPSASYSRFNEVIFVIDRSGSMNGEKIQSARAVLMLFLKSLPPGCRFNVVCFGSSHFFLFKEGSRVYSEETLAEACALHDKMDANMGGTEILQPLRAIYSQPVDPEFSRQVLMLTDGEVWNVDEVTELAARYASSTRVFTVGIGEGASTALVRGLARAGRGRAELVTQRDRMSTKVMGLVTSMLQSSVRSVNVSCELDPPSRLSLVPPEPPVIFAGQHLVTFARMPPGTQLKGVTLTGQVDGQEWRSSVAGAHLRTVHDANFALHRLAARASILHMCLHDGDEARDSVVELSTSSGVLCRHTALVAVDQDGKTVTQPPLQPAPHRVEFRRKCKRSAISSIPFSAPLGLLSGGRKLVMIGGGPSGASFKSSEEVSQRHEHCGLISTRSSRGLRISKRCSEDDAGKAEKSITMTVSSSRIPLSKRCSEDDAGKAEKSNSTDVFSGIIASQKFDGSWEASDVASVLEISADELLATQNAEAASVLVTCVAVVLLREHFSDRATEWNLLVTKALNFLNANSAEDTEKLLDAARQHLAALRSRHPSIERCLQ